MKCCKIQKIQLCEVCEFCIYSVFVLWAESATTSGSKVVQFSHVIQKYTTCKLRKAIFSVFYRISKPNFGFCLILKGSCRLFCFFRRDQNCFYNASCPLIWSLKNFFFILFSQGFAPYPVGGHHMPVPVGLQSAAPPSHNQPPSPGNKHTSGTSTHSILIYNCFWIYYYETVANTLYIS